MTREMQSNQFLFIFSVSLMILKLHIIFPLSCVFSKVNLHSLIDLSLNGNSFVHLLTAVNIVHFLILLYLLLSLNGLVTMIFSIFFYSFPLVFFHVPFCVLTVGKQGANDFRQCFTTGL